MEEVKEQRDIEVTEFTIKTDEYSLTVHIPRKNAYRFLVQLIELFKSGVEPEED